MTNSNNNSNINTKSPVIAALASYFLREGYISNSTEVIKEDNNGGNNAR